MSPAVGFTEHQFLGIPDNKSKGKFSGVYIPVIYAFMNYGYFVQDSKDPFICMLRAVKFHKKTSLLILGLLKLWKGQRCNHDNYCI